MLNFFRNRPRQTKTAFDVPIEAPGLVYAVGDIHGCADLAREIVDLIMDDAGRRDATIVFMGDHIDRGEQSRETLDFLMAFALMTPARTVFLRGNHEDMLLRFVRDGRGAGAWLRNGGLQTLMSYGVSYQGNFKDPATAERLRTELIEAMGGHLRFIEAMLPSHRIGNLFFAHAGADPAVAIEQQDRQAMLWGSSGFTQSSRNDGNWVVHGHYIVERGTLGQGRIAVDTGAYASQRLTAARIEDGRVRFLET